MTGSWTARIRAAQEQPQARVVLFPHAGGGPNALMPLVTNLPASYEVLGVTLPGRERRFGESCAEVLADPHAVVGAVLEELVARPQLPTVLFGHSMGAAMAAAVTLAKPGLFRGLVLSAYPSGGCAAELAGEWSDDDIVEIIRLGGGTPDEILQSPIWRAHLLEVMRSDLILGRRLAQEAFLGRLSVPLTVLSGTEDGLVPLSDLDTWPDRAPAGVRTRTFPGGHFYLLDEGNVAGVAGEIVRAVQG